MFKIKYIKLFITIFTLMILFSCSDNKLNIDVSNINVEINIKRLDKDLIKNYPDTVDVLALINKYGVFFDLYSQGILRMGSPNQKSFSENLYNFNKYCFETGIPKKIDEIFPNIQNIDNELTLALKHYKYYFPDAEIPQIYTIISAFNQSIVTDSNIIGIALDKYLGNDCEFYTQLSWDRYLVKRMHKEMIPIDCMKAYAMMEFEYNDSIDNLINNMVYEGKIAYFIDAMLPNTHDSLKLAYTEKQLYWANKNEEKVWSYFIENKLLFSTKVIDIRKIVGDAPFTSTFSNNSAPRIGVFIGRKIIHSYMNENPEITLKELMNNNNYQQILNKAKYKP